MKCKYHSSLAYQKLTEKRRQRRNNKHEHYGEDEEGR